MRPAPFGRLYKWLDARAAILADSANLVLPGVLNEIGQRAMDKLGTYRSRGHGRGSPIGRGHEIVPITPANRTEKDGRHSTGRAVWSDRSKYAQPHQGPQERARRLIGGWAGSPWYKARYLSAHPDNARHLCEAHS